MQSLDPCKPCRQPLPREGALRLREPLSPRITSTTQQKHSPLAAHAHPRALPHTAARTRISPTALPHTASQTATTTPRALPHTAAQTQRSPSASAAYTAHVAEDASVELKISSVSYSSDPEASMEAVELVASALVDDPSSTYYCVNQAAAKQFYQAALSSTLECFPDSTIIVRGRVPDTDLGSASSSTNSSSSTNTNAVATTNARANSNPSTSTRTDASTITDTSANTAASTTSTIISTSNTDTHISSTSNGNYYEDRSSSSSSSSSSSIDEPAITSSSRSSSSTDKPASTSCSPGSNSSSPSSNSTNKPGCQQSSTLASAAVCYVYPRVGESIPISSALKSSMQLLRYLKPGRVLELWAAGDKLERYRDAFARAHGSFLYISSVATAPALQSRGLGTQLLSYMLAIADKQRMPCYLEATSLQNQAFYERLGFSQVAVIRLGPKAPSTIIMSRVRGS